MTSRCILAAHSSLGYQTRILPLAALSRMIARAGRTAFLTFDRLALSHLCGSRAQSNSLLLLSRQPPSRLADCALDWASSRWRTSGRSTRSRWNASWPQGWLRTHLHRCLCRRIRVDLLRVRHCRLEERPLDLLYCPTRVERQLQTSET